MLKPKVYEHKYDGGVVNLLHFLDQKKSLLINKNEKAVFKKPIYLKGEKKNVIVECAFQWNAGFSEEVMAFTNNIHQKDGGTHLLGLEAH